MFLSRAFVLGVAASGMIATSFGAAQSNEIVSAAADEGVIDTVLAGLPIAPSLLFFAAGIVGLAVLSRRKSRKTTSLY